MSLTASIVIRSYNEQRWLGQALEAVSRQDLPSDQFEILLVDSGSNDATVPIAEGFGCRIERIAKEEFTFGRSLNIGCEAARGRYLVFISAHCVPTSSTWLRSLLAPLEAGVCHYVYGRQVGHAVTQFSERQIFAKYFPASLMGAQGGYFCNNANAAIHRDTWSTYRFDEGLTGLEDMELAKRMFLDGLHVSYAPEAPVYHIHEESWAKVRTRYEREAVALQRIMPEVHLHLSDFLRYSVSAILHDASEALRQRAFAREIGPIMMFRLMQYWGAYRGNNDHRRLSRLRKERYFYPK